jgi:ABC-2 type transport system ATP-binding protein
LAANAFSSRKARQAHKLTRRSLTALAKINYRLAQQVHTRPPEYHNPLERVFHPSRAFQRSALYIVMHPAIALHHVTKQYGARLAVAELALAVMPGEILGFLGPNGAGKTTTIRLLTGFLRPTRGVVQLLGYDMAQPAQARAARRQLGFVPDVAGLDPTATGENLLDELAELQGAPPVDRAALLAALDLAPQDLRRPLGRLSRGTRQKINLVQGLQHRPDLLVLDEPTEGLDPLAQAALAALLQAARGRGATIFFSSHALSEVEELCDRVALIRGGRLVAVEQMSRLRANLHRRVTLKVGPTPDLRAQLQTLPTIDQLTYEAGLWRFTVGDLPALLGLLSTLPVEDLVIEPPALSEIFLRYYRPNGGESR